ncbi:hypothetical protein N1851_016190 [Merluccius polli]|uniref:CAP-Gly domain-containing protein n=1 Tax=Merluccius polli TaxID=89951 RepID=A0AA47MRT0_MERPO|nr:hypothetical protein N1851_016190 [Merluccius polli]
MVTYFLLSACTWTFKGILCTCRFLWICPYNAVQFLPRKKSNPVDTRRRPKPHTVCERMANAGIPGSPEHTSALQKRLAKAERDVLSLKTRICCDRASWELRFNELQRKQEKLCMQLRSEVRLRDDNDPVDSNTTVSEELSSSQSNHLEVMGRFRSSCCPSGQWGGQSSCSAPSGCRTESVMSSNISAASRRSSRASHRCFAPHSPMDLQLGHRVRIMLPSGRISTGTVRYLGFLQGEPELCLGVELASPDHATRQDGSHRGQSYFQW